MDDPTNIRVWIELEPGSDPIAGAIDDGDGPRPFVGWLALIGLLERAMRGECGADDAT